MIQMGYDKAEPFLSYDDLTRLIEIVVTSINTELQRVSKEQELQLIVDYLFGLYFNQNYFTFFTLQSIKSITEEIFEHPIIRDFVLNLTERISLLLPIDEIAESRLIDTMTRSITRTKVQSDNSLMIKEVTESLYLNPEVLKLLLKDNFWLLTVFLVSLYFYKTEAYNASRT